MANGIVSRFHTLALAMEGPPKKKRRGGHQQRLAQQKAEPESDGRCETSALCLLLLNLFAWGYFSPQRVQQIAEMAVKDIEKSKEDPRILEDLYTLAKLGTKGKHANNIHAELMSKVEHVPKIPRPFKAAVPLKGFLNSIQSMLLPHEMFACIYTHYRQVWNTTILPSIDRMQRFWRAMRLHPQFQEHPLKSKPNWDRTTIPICHSSAWGRCPHHWNRKSLVPSDDELQLVQPFGSGHHTVHVDLGLGFFR